MNKYRKQVVVVGSARSGTSWLSETMARVFRYRLLFEPEHTDNTVHGNLIADRLIHEDNLSSNKEGVRYLDRVLRNRVDSDWIAHNSNRKYKMHLWPFIPKKFITKFVRGTLMAPFINQHFNVPVVHILRDPFDVIKSQKRSNFPWLYDLSYFYKQPELTDLVSKRYSVDIEDYTKRSKVEILALRWCLENIVVLRDVLEEKRNNYFIVKHEDLRSDINVYKKLCNDLGLDIIDSIEQEYKKPSTKSHRFSAVKGGAELNNLDEQALSEVRALLQKFDNTLYVEK